MNGQALKLSQQAEIESRLAVLREGCFEHCLADYSFANLWLFREVHQYRYHAGEFAGISGKTYDGQSHFLPLFDIEKAAPELLQQLAGQYGCLYPLSERQNRALLAKNLSLHWQCHENDADYLYPAMQFQDYAGRLLAKKRNLLRQFLSTYPAQCERFDSTKHQSDCTAVLQGWMQDKNKASGEADERPCLEALQRAAGFGFKGLVFYAQKQPIGFVLAEELQAGLWVVRFAKGLNRYNGLYPFMFQQLAREFAGSIEWLNFEQDMGSPGFRRSKRSYAPTALLPKWRALPLS